MVRRKKGWKKDGFGMGYSGKFRWSRVGERLEEEEGYGEGEIGGNGGGRYRKER